MSQNTKRLFSSLILLLIIYLSFKSFIFIILTLSIIVFISLTEFNLLFKKIFKTKNLKYFIFFLSSLLYLIYFSLLILFKLIPFNNENIISLIFIILICSMTDIGGYIFGKVIGGKKLTKISPNKTYAGLIGSFVLPLVISFFYYKYFFEFLVFEINVISLVLLISIISQLGDLIISFFKRAANVKDTGSIIPGHGGILDRIDGILFALPIGIILISN